MGGTQWIVVFWYEWGIHVTLGLSFLVQVMLLLLADIRRRKDWPVLNAIIWAGYTGADMVAVYALGHMSVLCRLPEHHLMALWAPLLLVHLGGQDSITAYAIEDNGLWLRHLLTFIVQIIGAAYVVYASSIMFKPLLLRWATILMCLVGFLKYGERVWSLSNADKYASSSLSATSYKDFRAKRQQQGADGLSEAKKSGLVAVVAHSLLDVPKQMFKGPTRYVKISGDQPRTSFSAKSMLWVVETQLSMLYDLLYTKAAVAHTVCGVCIRAISLSFTVITLVLFHALRRKDGYYYNYTRVDVVVTNVLLTGAVVLEAMTVLRAVFSVWTVALLFERDWHKLAHMVASVEQLVIRTVKVLLGQRQDYWSGSMRQNNMFAVFFHSNYRTGSQIAECMGREDWWDSMFYSNTTHVPDAIIDGVLELVSTTQDIRVDDISRSQGLSAVRRYISDPVSKKKKEQKKKGKALEEEPAVPTTIREIEVVVDDGTSKSQDLISNAARTSTQENQLVTLIKGLNMELDDSILVWHIATNVYISWYMKQEICSFPDYMIVSLELSCYMFFLLASRPYMLPYPVTRERYVQLCHDYVTHLSCCFPDDLREAIVEQKDDLMKGDALKSNPEKSIGVSTENNTSINSTLDGGSQLAAHLIHRAAVAGNADAHNTSMNSTLDGGCQLAAHLIHRAEAGNAEVIMEMIFHVWVDMLCYTAYGCNEKSHAQNLTSGGDILTIVALMMVYMTNGFIERNNGAASSTSAAPEGAIDGTV